MERRIEGKNYCYMSYSFFFIINFFRDTICHYLLCQFQQSIGLHDSLKGSVLMAFVTSLSHMIHML